MKIFVLGLLINIWFAQFCSAGSLSTGFAEVLVRNLDAGDNYSLEKEANLPLIINNNSEQAISLKIEILQPEQGELKAGFEPIPDIRWIELTRQEFLIEPGESAKTDVIIYIPDEELYLGKAYQVYLWSHTVGESVGVGLKSRLLFTVGRDAKE